MFQQIFCQVGIEICTRRSYIYILFTFTFFLCHNISRSKFWQLFLYSGRWFLTSSVYITLLYSLRNQVCQVHSIIQTVLIQRFTPNMAIKEISLDQCPISRNLVPIICNITFFKTAFRPLLNYISLKNQHHNVSLLSPLTVNTVQPHG